MDASSRRLIQLFKAAPGERLAPIYERHGVKPVEGPEDLAREIELDGANTLASLFRGFRGVSYVEVVKDVARHMKVALPEDAGADESALELAILDEVIARYMRQASREDREKIEAILSEVGKDYDDLSRKGLHALLRELGRRKLAPMVARMIIIMLARTAGRRVAIRAAQLAGFAVPLLNLWLLGWTVVDVAGPAYRKTVPTVIEVALLRLEHGADAQAEQAA